MPPNLGELQARKTKQDPFSKIGREKKDYSPIVSKNKACTIRDFDQIISLCFESRAHFIAQTGLKLAMILLPLPPE